MTANCEVRPDSQNASATDICWLIFPVQCFAHICFSRSGTRQRPVDLIVRHNVNDGHTSTKRNRVGPIIPLLALRASISTNPQKFRETR